MKRIVALLAALALCVCAGAAAKTMHEEVAHPSITMDVSVGYQGAAVYLKPMPITALIHNQGADFTGTVAVNVYRDPINYDRYEMAVALPQGASKQVTLPVTLRALQKTFTVELVKDGQVICAVNSQPASALSPYSLLVGVMGTAPEKLGYLNLSADKDELLRGEIWQTVTLDQASFPNSADMLSAFGILALSDFDARTLSIDQQQALDRWLRGGGVLILGGGGAAQATYPCFETYTKLTPGPIEKAPDITPGLMTYVGMTGAAQGGEFILNHPQGAGPDLTGADAPLLYATRVGGGLILCATFELAAVAPWRTAPTLWQRVLLTCAAQSYAQLFNRGQSEYNYWEAQNLISAIPVDNPGNLYGALAVVAAFLALAGPGAYLLLKKADKREWMWGALPLATLAAGAVIWAMSAVSPLNQPIAVTVGALRYTGDGVKADTLAGVSSADRQGVLLSSPDGGVAPMFMDGYYEEPEDQQIKEPTKRAYRYILGTDGAVEFPAAAPWSVNYLTVGKDAPDAGTITGEVWAEADGLHARIDNGTPYVLEDGYLLTPLGYAVAPAIMPGGSAQVAILEGEPPQVKGDAAGIVPGKLWTGRKSHYGGYILDGYSLVDAIIYPEQQLDPDAQPAEGEMPGRQMRQTLLNMVTNGRADFAYAGFNDRLGDVTLTKNGAPIARSAHKGVLWAGLDYRPVGPTGVVRHIPGTLTPYDVRLAADGTPQIDMQMQKAMTFDLQSGAQRLFGFVVPDIQKLAVDTVNLSASYVQGLVTFYLYNHQTGQWDQQEGAFLSLKGEQAAPYLGAEGQLIVKAGTGGGAQTYGYVDTPFIDVKGRVK